MMRAHRSLAALALTFALAPAAHAATSSGAVASPMGGNGHNVTFDGRLFLVAHGDGSIQCRHR